MPRPGWWAVVRVRNSRLLGELGAVRGRAPRSSSGSDGLGDGEDVSSLVVRGRSGDRSAVEVAELVRLASGQDGPGPLDKLAGDRDVGLGVAVTAFNHEVSVVGGELGIDAARAGGLIER